MTSRTASSFWKKFHQLPLPIQHLARKNHKLWLANFRHPSVRFKPVAGRLYSARVGRQYRALGYFSNPNEFVWTWIGTHVEYDRITRQPLLALLTAELPRAGLTNGVSAGCRR